jgi:hypothetical protein
MASDPKNKVITIPIPLSTAKVRMTKGLADFLGLTITAGWPSAPTAKDKKLGGLRNRAKGAGKVAIMVLTTGQKYSIRYSGTFRRAYSFLKEGSPNFADDVQSFYTERKGSRVTNSDTILAE